jgi:hypothetical protein
VSPPSPWQGIPVPRKYEKTALLCSCISLITTVVYGKLNTQFTLHNWHHGVNRFTLQFLSNGPHCVNRFRPQPHGAKRLTSQLLSQDTTYYGVNRFTSQLRHQGVKRFTSQLTSRCEPVQIPASLCKISRRKAIHILTTVWTGSHFSFCLTDHTLRCEPVQIPASLCETSRCEAVRIPAPLSRCKPVQIPASLCETSRCEPVHISDPDLSTSHTWPTGHVNDIKGQRRYGWIAENW